LNQERISWYKMPRKAKHRKNVRTLIRNLRSKKWQQGEGKLAQKSSDGTERHCCLGVASELSPAVRSKSLHGNRTLKYFSFDGEHNYLPEVAMKWLGVKSPNPLVKMPDGSWRTLAALNDNEYSLKRIADILDAQPYEWDGIKGEENAG
jgi:hypothetical protein